MRTALHQVDAFASRPFEGNPAAICPLETWLPDELLQAIAEENRLSETAYLLEENGTWHLRWFTPKSEVDLCGHATLAAAHILFATVLCDEAEVIFETRSGPLPVRREDGWLTLDFPARPGETCDAPEALREGFGVAPLATLRADDYLAVFESEEQVRALSPDFRRLGQLDGRGVIATAPGSETDFSSRFFAPKFGIDEDPVTGSAHCALAPYWAERLGKTHLSARQVSDRTGELRCRIAGDRVHISGRAVSYLEGVIEFPDELAQEA